ncbi:MAG: outer membrane protein assembly factor [Spirulina sp. SIO3F2]|nr:outer membrane protein assembly factor [Spirulina sp. SIO3F2]
MVAIATTLTLPWGQADITVAQTIKPPKPPARSVNATTPSVAKPDQKLAVSPDEWVIHTEAGQLAPTQNQTAFFDIDQVDTADEPDVNFGRNFRLVPGLGVPRPSALQGLNFLPAVRAGVPNPRGAIFPLRLEALNVGGKGQTLSLRALAGADVLGLDLSFRDPQIGTAEDGLGYAVNLFGLSHEAATFQNGRQDVDLSTGNNPHEIRFGGGVQFFRPIADNTEIALGLNYQSIAFSNSQFGSRRFSQDEFGNALTASGNSRDDLLMLNITALVDARNDQIFPTQGSRLQAGFDQAIPVGAAESSFTRLGLNYTYFVPVDLIRLPETGGTLLLNIQGGLIPFDAPPSYEAYALGGSSSVRGFETGELGSPRNFIQGTLEYRFPFANLRPGGDFLKDILGDRVTLAANVFLDAATGFDSDDKVLGRPGAARNKPGEGYGYGVGLLATSSVGLIRLEFGIADTGDTSLSFVIGDRF